MHCTAWGEGDEAVLRYLARYVFRVAITNTRIVGLDDKGVTIRHKERKSRKWQTTLVLIVRVLEAPQPSSARRPDHLSFTVQ